MSVTPASSEKSSKHDSLLMTAAEWVIFRFSYALTALYVVMTLASLSYLIHAAWETSAFAIELWQGNANDNIVGVLTLLDDMMITSLLFLIIGGSFLVYVKGKLDDHVYQSSDERPPAFKHLSPSSLKTKMSGALVGVSAVLIIRILVEALTVDAAGMDLFIKRTLIVAGIHLVLVISLMVFARISMGKDHSAEHTTETPAH